jgi:hypothetical protein
VIRCTPCASPLVLDCTVVSVTTAGRPATEDTPAKTSTSVLAIRVRMVDSVTNRHVRTAHSPMAHRATPPRQANRVFQSDSIVASVHLDSRTVSARLGGMQILR